VQEKVRLRVEEEEGADAVVVGKTTRIVKMKSVASIEDHVPSDTLPPPIRRDDPAC
jgi:hypothetical protein